MDRTRDQFAAGRRTMIGAFVEMSDLARRAGIDEDTITDLHGRFFDGNVSIRAAFRTAVTVADIFRPRKARN